MLYSKLTDSTLVATIELVSVIVFGLILTFNSKKTLNLDEQYDELNITASDYTIYVNVTAAHRLEFNERFGNKLEQ